MTKIPPGYQAVAPYLVVDGAAAAILFYQQAFSAVEHMRLVMPDGTIGHAEVRIGGSTIMLGEPSAQRGVKSPKELGGSPASLHLYVEDSDAIFAQAVAAGAAVVQPVETMFWGDRAGKVRDPFGYEWMVSSHVEDVSLDEIHRRLAAMPGA